MNLKFIFGIIFVLFNTVNCLPIGTVVQSQSSTSQSKIFYPESALQEAEGLPSRIFAKYDDSQSYVGNFLNPKPIVDGLKEEDKYGNTGDKFVGIGKGLINGFEAFSNIFNRIIDTPFEITKQISRSLTTKLNDTGAKLLGL